MINFRLTHIKDTSVRDALEDLQSYLSAQAILKGEWKFITLRFTGAVSNYRYPHKLSFTPRDVIQTAHTGTGIVVFNYDKFDSTHLDVTTTDACEVRFLIGRIA